MRYPFLHQGSEEDDAFDSPLQPNKKTEELTAEEKEQLEARAKQFGVDLEQCMYELYAEPDKQGKMGVAAKYKYVSVIRFVSLSLDSPRSPLQGAVPDAYV